MDGEKDRADLPNYAGKSKQHHSGVCAVTQYKATKHKHKIVGQAGNEDRRKDDYYPTPYTLTRALLDNEPFEGTVLEPACGEGAILDVLTEYGFLVAISDINKPKRDLGNFRQGDFVRNEFLWTDNDIGVVFDNVITNPPFSLANEFTIRAKQIARKKVAMLLKLDYLHGGKRFDTIFNDRDFPLSRVITFVRRPWLGGDPAVNKLNGQFSYAWMVFKRGYAGEPRLCIVDNRTDKIKRKATARSAQGVMFD